MDIAKLQYDPNHKGFGVYACMTCHKETPTIEMGICEESLHTETCEKRREGAGACTYTFGDLDLIILRQGQRGVVGPLSPEMLMQHNLNRLLQPSEKH
jgi:hypothetical protein